MTNAATLLRNILMEGDCCHKDLFSIEPHGKGFALYRGRCNHRHGYNLAFITETNQQTLDLIVTALNKELT